MALVINQELLTDSYHGNSNIDTEYSSKLLPRQPKKLYF